MKPIATSSETAHPVSIRGWYCISLFNPPPKSGKFLTENQVEPGDTLSHISLYHYGAAIIDLRMPIYEASRDIIGCDPNRILPGQVLKISDIKDHIWRMKSRHPMELSLDNPSLLDVDVFWIDCEGREIYRGSMIGDSISV